MLYATLDELAEAGVDLDGDSDAMLEAASNLVADATRNDFYVTDEAKLPVVEEMKEAMATATIQQVQAWVKAGVGLSLIVGGQGALAPQLTSTSIGSGSVGFDPSRRDTGQLRMVSKLVPAAFRTLRRAGLASAGVG